MSKLSSVFVVFFDLSRCRFGSVSTTAARKKANMQVHCMANIMQPRCRYDYSSLRVQGSPEEMNGTGVSRRKEEHLDEKRYFLSKHYLPPSSLLTLAEGRLASSSRTLQR